MVPFTAMGKPEVGAGLICLLFCFVKERNQGIGVRIWTHNDSDTDEWVWLIEE